MKDLIKRKGILCVYVNLCEIWSNHSQLGFVVCVEILTVEWQLWFVHTINILWMSLCSKLTWNCIMLKYVYYKFVYVCVLNEIFTVDFGQCVHCNAKNFREVGCWLNSRKKERHLKWWTTQDRKGLITSAIWHNM